MFLFTLFYTVSFVGLQASLVSKLGSVDLALKYEVVDNCPLSCLSPPLATFAPNVAYSSTVVTSFWKSKRLTYLFFWIVFILLVAYNVLLTVGVWISAGTTTWTSISIDFVVFQVYSPFHRVLLPAGFLVQYVVSLVRFLRLNW